MRKGRIIGHDACGIRADTGERVVMVPVINCGHFSDLHNGLPTIACGAILRLQERLLCAIKAMPPELESNT
jgi:threonine dehydrogenase-like Zn-dependent dehydrogenase